MTFSTVLSFSVHMLHIYYTPCLTPEPPVFAVRTCQLCGAKLQDTVITRNDSPDLVLKESISQAMEEVIFSFCFVCSFSFVCCQFLNFPT